MKRTPSGLQKRQQTFLSLIFFFFPRQISTEVLRVKRGKHDCMVNRAFVFLSSTFIFLFTNKRNFILVIFFFPVILFFWQSPFVATRMCLKCILQNLKCELLFFSSKWIPLPCSVCAFTSNNRTDKWRCLKSLLKLTWAIFYLILPQQTHYDTRALSLLAFIVAEPVLWSL